MLDIDRLPDDRQLVLVEARILEQRVQRLVALEQPRRLGHHCMEPRDHPEVLHRLLEKRLALLRRGGLVVLREIGHASLLSIRFVRRLLAFVTGR